MSALRRPLTAWAALVIGLAILGMAEARGDTVFLESGGQVVGEAEHYSARTGARHQWAVIPDESVGFVAFQNARGGQYIQSLPDLYSISVAPQPPVTAQSTPPSPTSHFVAGLAFPFIDYRIRISTPGEYQLYLRWDGHDKDSDSMFASIAELLTDTEGYTASDWYELSRDPSPLSDADFATAPWEGLGGKGVNSWSAEPRVPITWNLGAGDWTLRLGMREDGSAIDTWILQLKDMVAPTGIGPAESAIVPLPSALPAGMALLGLWGLARRLRRQGHRG